MARNETVTLTAGAFTQLTNADAVNARVQNIGPALIWVQATANTTPPTTTSGGIRFDIGEGDAFIISEMFPGVSGADRLWAWSDVAGAASVSHD